MGGQPRSPDMTHPGNHWAWYSIGQFLPTQETGQDTLYTKTIYLMQSDVHVTKWNSLKHIYCDLHLVDREARGCCILIVHGYHAITYTLVTSISTPSTVVEYQD